MRSLIILLSVCLVIAGVGFFGFSANLSKTHHVEADAIYERALPDVWQLMTTVEKASQWSSLVAHVESLGMKDGKPAWHVQMKDGHFMDIQLHESIPMKQFSFNSINGDIPLEGTWTLSFEALGEQRTSVKMVQEASTKNPVMRFILHYFIGLDRFITTVLKDAGNAITALPKAAAPQPAAATPATPVTPPSPPTPTAQPAP